MATTRRWAGAWGGIILGCALSVGCGSSSGKAPTDASSTGDAGPTDGGADRIGDGGVCTQAFAAIAPTPPDILILMDRSGSMADIFRNGQSKFTVLSQAINSLVSATDSRVNWGLELYGDDDACGVNAGAQVGVGSGSAGAIAAAVQVAPSGETPTETAIGSAVAYLHGLTDSNPKYLLLASGGQMNCAPGADPSADDSTGAESAVATANSAGYPTFVVGVVDPTAEVAATGTLNHMAIVGGVMQKDTTTSFYQVTDLAGLTTSLTLITSGTQTCTFALGSPATGPVLSVSATSASGTTVVPSDSANGWTIATSGDALTLNGSACADVQSGVTTGLSVSYHCGG